MSEKTVNSIKTSFNCLANIPVVMTGTAFFYFFYATRKNIFRKIINHCVWLEMLECKLLQTQ